MPLTPDSRLTWMLVRFLERLGALVGLVLLAPLLVLTALAVAILSRKPPLLAHLRIGLGGKPFWG
jgi:lipopolysaccharide/colanic/teichoic acid biosynthesis glycosyltransferase